MTTPRAKISGRWLIVPLLIAAALSWVAVPAFAAAGLALDHPAWAAPDIDPPAGPLTADEASWWPPGHRYQWAGQSSGRPIERIDPWGHPAAGHAWTASVAAATGFAAWSLWRGTAPLARIRQRRRPDVHRWERVS